MPIRLVLADDHPIVLDGLEQLFRLTPDLSVVARCRNGEETLRALRLHRPDVLILDIRMPRGDGLEVMRTLNEERLPTRVVVLTADLEEAQLLEALRLGVGGIVLKETAPRLLIEAVREVHSGGRWVDKSSASRALEKLLRRENEGGETILARLGAGEYFGEMALLNKTTRNATIRCVTAMDTLSLPKNEFGALAANLPELRAAFEQRMQQRMAAGKN